LLLAAGVVFFLGGIGAFEGEADKALATLDAEGFSVRMPGHPERSTKTIPTAGGTIPLVLYLSESSDKAYTVSYLDLPPGVKGDLKAAVAGAAAAVRGTARDEVETAHQGFPARDARIANASDRKGNKATVFTRVILAKGRVYQLQYVEAGDAERAPAAYSEFLGSLKIS